MSKIKNFFIKSGALIAVFLMFGPLYIVTNSSAYSQKEFWFYLIVWILYDFFMCDYIFNANEKQKEKEHYWKYIKNADKKLNIELSYKEKFENLEEYIENYFNK